MPKTSSFADVVLDWESLLIATEQHALDIPEAERHRASLTEHLVFTRQLKAAQDSAIANKQQATQDLQAAVVKGRELAIRVRGAVRAALGPKSERLVQFGITPIRKRRRAAAGEGPVVVKALAPPQPGDKLEN